MKRTKLLTSLSALALVLSLGACDVTECDEVGETGGVGSVEEKDYKISFESNGYAYAIGLAESADEGDKVEFKVTVESGFVIDEVSAVYLIAGEEATIEVEESAGAYSFVMPASDVTVKASAVGGYFKAWYDEDAEVITDYNEKTWKQSDLIRGFYELETGVAITTESNTLIKAGSEVLVVPYRQYTLGDYDLYANGEKLELIEDEELNAGLYAYRLVMPANDCEITVKASEKLVSVSLEENEYVDAYLYLESAPNEQLQSISGLKVANDKVYVHAEITEDAAEEGYVIKSVVSSANTYAVPQQYGTATTETSWETDWLDQATISGDFKYVGDNEVYYEVPQWYFADDEFTISFDAEIPPYADYNFVGSWTGSEIYNSAVYGSGATMEISAFGNVSGTVSSSVASVNDDGLLLADGRQLFISSDGKLSAVYWSAYATLNANDIYLFAHTTEEVTFSCFKIYGSIQYIVEVFVGGESWGLLYADNSTTKILNFDVTISFTGESTSLDELDPENETYPTFNVLDADGNTLAEINGKDSYYL